MLYYMCVGDGMPCYHPLLAVDVGQRSPTGTILYKIARLPESLRPGIDKHVSWQYDGWYPCDESKGHPYQVIPCGKCIGCRLEYSRQWANRCMLELQYHESAYFVTLTYDDYHVPISYYADPDTGEAMPSMSLCKRDLQLFLKRLRKRFEGQRIRFFACGEYGPSTWRPHYHLIIFGLKLPDLVPIGEIRGNRYYTSQILQSVWSAGVEVPSLIGDKPAYSGKMQIGHISITDVTWETCAYTARYITKKLNGPEAQFYTDFALAPPFVDMSRRPGIARQWYDDHPDYNTYDYINVSTPTGGYKFRPPHYYDKLYDVDYPEESARIKAIRQRLALESVKRKLERTDLNYIEYMAVEESNFKARISSLQRGDI